MFFNILHIFVSLWRYLHVDLPNLLYEVKVKREIMENRNDRDGESGERLT